MVNAVTLNMPLLILIYLFSLSLVPKDLKKKKKAVREGAFVTSKTICNWAMRFGWGNL